MAKRKINKSVRIRELLKTGITSPAAIAEKLKAENIHASAALISNVKARMSNGKAGGKKKRGKKPGRKPGRKPQRSLQNGSFVHTLLEAKKFVTSAGSVEAAREAIDVLVKLG